MASSYRLFRTPSGCDADVQNDEKTLHFPEGLEVQNFTIWLVIEDVTIREWLSFFCEWKS